MEFKKIKEYKDYLSAQMAEKYLRLHGLEALAAGDETDPIDKPCLLIKEEDFQEALQLLKKYKEND